MPPSTRDSDGVLEICCKCCELHLPTSSFHPSALKRGSCIVCKPCYNARVSTLQKVHLSCPNTRLAKSIRTRERRRLGGKACHVSKDDVERILTRWNRRCAVTQRDPVQGVKLTIVPYDATRPVSTSPFNAVVVGASGPGLQQYFTPGYRWPADVSQKFVE